jgi:hypothetical protein
MYDSSFQSPPKKLFTFTSGGWVLLLAGFCTLLAALLVLYPVYTSGGFHRYVGDGKNVDTYGFDLSNLTIPKDQLAASGHPKDYLREIPENLVETITPEEVKLIGQNEHIRFLVPSDRVVGITLNGISRAYPVRVLNLHEVVNDTLGTGAQATPIAVTYSPFTDSVVVFDRRIDGPSALPAEFGNSGLLVCYNAVFFDRRANTAQESLWPQLALRAVSGPHAGSPMTLIPYELTTWQKWTAAHPDTRVLLGLRTLKVEYSGDPFSTYHSTDSLPFDMQSNWKEPGVPRKTPVLLHSADGNHWTASPPQTAVPAAETRIYSYVFGWFGQHPDDTDYSAIKPAPGNP